MQNIRPQVWLNAMFRVITVFELNTAYEAENLARVHPICNEWPCMQLELPSVFRLVNLPDPSSSNEKPGLWDLQATDY